MKRTPVNDNYFKKINSEDKAYFLGLIATDGTISGDLKNQKRRKLTIKLKAEDAHILKKFKKCLKTEKKLYYYGVKYYGKTKTKSNPVYALEINSEKIHSDLTRLGIGENKTKLLNFPNYKIVPKNLIRHYIRGVFDGDGSINQGATSEIGLTFTSGSKRFLTGLKKELSKLGVKNTWIMDVYRFKGKIKVKQDYWYFKVRGHLKKKKRTIPVRDKLGRIVGLPKSKQALNIRKFYKLIYQNSSKELRLKRKFKKFNKILFISTA